MTKSKSKVYILNETYFKFKFEYNQQNRYKIKRAIKSGLLSTFLKNKKNKELLKFTIEFEEGSLKTRITIWGATIYMGIANYGSFRAGVREIYNDGRAFSSFIKEQILESEEIDNDDILRFEKRTGITGRINEIYYEIEKLERNTNNLTANQIAENLNKIKQKIANINSILEPDSIEQDEFLDSFAPQYSNNLPNPDERKTNYLINRYSLIREDEIEYLEE